LGFLGAWPAGLKPKKKTVMLTEEVTQLTLGLDKTEEK
jgi:hypothetical protein